ncbi:MAG: flavodoxin [Prevotella sp.]|nr:flavodoxin [Prevotella sp.]
MRKILLISLLTLATFSMAACGDDEEKQPAPEQQEPPIQPGEGGDDADDNGNGNAGDKGNDNGNNNGNETTTSMRMKIKADGRTITATMEDNAAARDLLSRLPMTVRLNDFNNTTEKIFYPEPPLTTEGVTRGCTPTPGDITIYEPWGNVAIFCKRWPHSGDLIKIGHIDGDGIEVLNIGGDITVTLER